MHDPPSPLLPLSLSLLSFFLGLNIVPPSGFSMPTEEGLDDRGVASPGKVKRSNTKKVLFPSCSSSCSCPSLLNTALDPGP